LGDIVLLDIVRAKGHEKVRALHKTTFEITRDDYLTERGDCIIGISSDKTLNSLSSRAKDFIRSGGRLAILLVSGNAAEIVHCYGDSSLGLKNDRKIIVRKSSYTDDATLCIRSDKSAADLSRDLIEELAEKKELLMVIFGVSGSDQ